MSQYPRPLSIYKTLYSEVSLRRLTVLILITAIMLAGCGSPDTGGLSVGDTAPDFSLASASGEPVSLSKYTGEQPVLLFFHMAMG
jgi:hypothetical protein